VDPHGLTTRLVDESGQLVGSSYDQKPVIGQLAAAIFDHFTPGLLLRHGGDRD
jgi:hypothetical protein